MKSYRRRMAEWKSNSRSNSQKRIHELQELLHQEYDSQFLVFYYIYELKSELNHQYRFEKEFWRTKSRIQWLQTGDRNTMYFYEKTKQRRSFNRITSIIDGLGKVCFKDDEVQHVIKSYFAYLYTSKCSEDMDQALSAITPKVSQIFNLPK